MGYLRKGKCIRDEKFEGESRTTTQHVPSNIFSDRKISSLFALRQFSCRRKDENTVIFDVPPGIYARHSARSKVSEEDNTDKINDCRQSAEVGTVTRIREKKKKSHTTTVQSCSELVLTFSGV